MGAIKRTECRITGRVQMVMFRDFAKRTARAHGLTGYVRNEDDGSVVVVAEGEEGIVRAYIEELKKGSFLSRVDGVEAAWREPTGEFKDFTIMHT